MATVTLTGGSTGSGIALAADTLFFVRDGKVELSTDGGTTYIPFHQGERFLVSSGLTVTPKCGDDPDGAIIDYMSF